MANLVPSGSEKLLVVVEPPEPKRTNGRNACSSARLVSVVPFDFTFEYGRPKKPHGWQPFSNAELVKMIEKFRQERRVQP